LDLIRNTKKRIITLLAILILIPFALIIQTYLKLPNSLMLLEGEELVYDLASPIKLDAEVDKSGVLSLNGEIIENKKVNVDQTLRMKSDRTGNYNLKLKLFGLIPLRSVKVDVVPKINIVPCGNTVGVKLYTDGVLIIGFSEFSDLNGRKISPAKEAGVREGDIIESINNKKVNNIEDLTEIVRISEGKPLNMRIIRKDKKIHYKITPLKPANENEYKLGMWVRDSTAGIGTLTFYNPDTQKFGALGHGITDVDTGELLKVGKGSILNSKIISVKKGEKGKPGELKGVFIQEGSDLGIIEKNCEFGIFGKLQGTITSPYAQPMQIGLRHQIKEGPAYILSNIEGDKVEKFNVTIQKVIRQNDQSSKGMIIKITDPRLLNATGGIVQGMSGSPIIQDDKVIGAVTHVLVNDPTRGYGVFIEWMLQNTGRT